MNLWCIELECIYRSLAKENQLKVEAQVNADPELKIRLLLYKTEKGQACCSICLMMGLSGNI